MSMTTTCRSSYKMKSSISTFQDDEKKNPEQHIIMK